MIFFLTFSQILDNLFDKGFLNVCIKPVLPNVYQILQNESSFCKCFSNLCGNIYLPVIHCWHSPFTDTNHDISIPWLMIPALIVDVWFHLSVYSVNVIILSNTDWRRQNYCLAMIGYLTSFSSSLKTCQGSCLTIVDVLSTVTMWMEPHVT